MGTDAGAPASVRRRIAAFLLDLVVVSVLARAVAGRLSDSRLGRALTSGILAALGGMGYHVLTEGRWGRTVGKAAVGIAVVGADGTPCTYRAAAIRTAMRLVDWLPTGYLLGLLSIALTTRDQRLGDLAAGTVVVRTRGPADADTARRAASTRTDAEPAG